MSPSDLALQPSGRLSGWDRAHSGLSVFYKGLVTYVVTLVAMVVLGVVAALARSASLQLLLVVAGTALLVVATLLMLVGLRRYADVPAASGGRGLAWGAFLCYGVQFVLLTLALFALASVLLGKPSRAWLEYVQIADPISRIVGLAGQILLLLSVQRVARHVAAHSVAQNARTVLVLQVILFAVAVLIMLAAKQLAGLGPGFLIIALGLLVFAIITVVMFLKTIAGLRDALLGGMVEVADVF